MQDNKKIYRFFDHSFWYFEEIKETLYKLREEIINLRKLFKDMFSIDLFDHEIADFVEFFGDEFDLKQEKAIAPLKTLKKDVLAVHFDKWIEKKKREICDDRIKAPKDFF